MAFCHPDKKVEEAVQEIRAKDNWIGQAEAWIQYFFRIDVDSLSDDQFAEKFAQVQYVAQELKPKK